MAKFALKPSPTFKAKVEVPVPGAKAAQVEFTFRHRTREELASWLEAIEGKTGKEVVLEAACGWELEEPFDAENVAALLDNYIGAFQAVLDTYLKQLAGAREKN
jgi:hypothetical protein